jgi:hypothetical protein
MPTEKIEQPYELPTYSTMSPGGLLSQDTVANDVGQAASSSLPGVQTLGGDPVAETAVAPAPDNTVETRLTGLLAKDSNYMKQARAGAAQTANQRGLLNTSLTATGGESAAIAAALPIAAQDSTQAHALTQQAKGFEGQGGLLAQDIAGNLTAQTQKEAATAALLDQQIQGDLAKQQLDITSKEAIASLNIQSTDRNHLASVSSVIGNTFAGAINAINSNTAMPAEERVAAIADIRAQQAAYLDLYETLYNVDLGFPGTSQTPVSDQITQGATQAAAAAGSPAAAVQQATAQAQQIAADNGIDLSGVDLTGPDPMTAEQAQSIANSISTDVNGALSIGNFGPADVLGAVGTLASLATGVAGLGVLGTAIGAAIEANAPQYAHNQISVVSAVLSAITFGVSDFFGTTSAAEQSAAEAAADQAADPEYNDDPTGDNSGGNDVGSAEANDASMAGDPGGNDDPSGDNSGDGDGGGGGDGGGDDGGDGGGSDGEAGGGDSDGNDDGW